MKSSRFVMKFTTNTPPKKYFLIFQGSVKPFILKHLATSHTILVGNSHRDKNTSRLLGGILQILLSCRGFGRFFGRRSSFFFGLVLA